MHICLKASVSAFVLVLACANMASAHAASPSEAVSSAPDASVDGSDIVVTAQKRSERLLDVPASISVLRADTFERTGSSSLADYATYVPGLTVNSGGTPGRAKIVLRGISTGGGGALVGTYLDDTPVGSSSGFGAGGSFQLDLFPYDVDRLEVLRGPQGTLYGASAMGGLLKYVLRQADPNKFEVRAGGLLESTASTGHPTWGSRAAINVPLNDGTLAVRASGFYQNNAGWIDNPGRGTRNENDSTQKGGRAALFWQPTPSLQIKAAALLQDIKADANAVVQLDGTTLEPTFNKYSRFTRLADPFTQRLRYYSLTGDWDAGFATLTSATSWSRSRNISITDESPSYAPFFPLIDPSAPSDGLSDFLLDVRLRKFTQEVRLASKSGGRIEWLLGGFYTKESVLNIQSLGAYDSRGAPIASLTPFAVVDFPTTFREYAAFGNVTYKFSSAFDITGGFRYSHNKQDYFQVLSGALIGGVNTETANSSANVKTFSASARFRPTTRSMFYARVANGYRPGGPNVALPGIPPSYAADRLTNYEVGYKAALFDGKLDVELAGFYIDWKDIQIAIIRGGITFPGNGGKASSRGFEATGVYRITPDLRLSTNASYTDAKLDEDVPTLFGRDGDQLPNAPRWTTSAALDYSREIGNQRLLSAGVAYRYRGPSLTGLQSDPQTLRVRPQNIVDTYVGLTVGAVTARLYTRNLFNNRSYTTYFDPDAGKSSNFVPVQPRTVGMSVDVKM